MPEEADTIDRVLDELDEIIVWSRERSSRLGYFPALYRKVTAKVKEGIEQHVFDDGDRMERLDVVFANRYLSAIQAHHQGCTPLMHPRLAERNGGCHRHRRPRCGSLTPRDKRHRITNFL